MSSFSALLHLEGQVYDLTWCFYTFHQHVDARGRPRSKVRKGPIHLELSAIENCGDLIEWAIQSEKTLSGKIVFTRADSDAPVKHIWFTHAFCTRCTENFDSTGTTGLASLRLLLAISPEDMGVEAGGGGTWVAPPAREYAYAPLGAAAPPAGAVAGPPPVALLASVVARPPVALPAGVFAGPPLTPPTGVVAGPPVIPPSSVVGSPPAAPPAVAVANPILPLPPHLPAPIPNPSPDHKQVHLSAQQWQDLIKDRWDDSDAAKSKKFKFTQENCMTEFHVDGDPFTYRTDAEGKVVAVYDAQEQKSYNVTGTRKGLTRIPLTLKGGPTFAGTPHMYPPGPPHLTVVTIPMAGNRKGDFLRANKAAGLEGVVLAQGKKSHQAPAGYTWHHLDDFQPNATPPPYGTCTMELVKTEAHEDTFVHFGSCDQCNEYHGKKLYK